MKRLVLIMVLVMAAPLSLPACGMGEQTADGYENAPVSHVH